MSTFCITYLLTRTQTDTRRLFLIVRHHSALLSVSCVHVLMILYRFYIPNVISKCDFLPGLP